MLHCLHPHELAPGLPRFDAVEEGRALGLSRAAAIALWDRICAEHRGGDDAALGLRFRALAAWLASRQRRIGKGTQVEPAAPAADGAPGRQTLVDAEAPRDPAEAPRATGSVADVFDAAAAGAPAALPFQRTLEHLFGRTLDHLRAFTGRQGQLDRLGVRAAARGETVVFGPAAPDLALVTHEVTHALQNERGRGRNAVSQRGDRAEQEAEHLAGQAAHRHAPGALAVRAQPTAAIQLEWHPHTVPGQWIDDVTGHIFDSNTSTYYAGWMETQLEGGQLRAVIQQILFDDMLAKLRKKMSLPLARELARLARDYESEELLQLARHVLSFTLPVGRLVDVALRVGAHVEPDTLGWILQLHPFLANDGDLADLVRAAIAGLPVRMLVNLIEEHPTLTAADAIQLVRLHATHGATRLGELALGVTQGVPAAIVVAVTQAYPRWSSAEVLCLTQLHADYGEAELLVIAAACAQGLPLLDVVGVAQRNPEIAAAPLCALLALHTQFAAPDLDQLAQEIIIGADVDNVTELAAALLPITVTDLIALVGLTHDTYSTSALIAMVPRARALNVPIATLTTMLHAVFGLEVDEAIDLVDAIANRGCGLGMIQQLLETLEPAELAALLTLHAGAYAQPQVIEALAAARSDALPCTRIVALAGIALVMPDDLVALLALAKRPLLAPGLEQIFAYAPTVPSPIILELGALDNATPVAVCEGLSLYKYARVRDVLAALTRAVIEGVPVATLIAVLDEIDQLPGRALISLLAIRQLHGFASRLALVQCARAVGRGLDAGRLVELILRVQPEPALCFAALPGCQTVEALGALLAAASKHKLAVEQLAALLELIDGPALTTLLGVCVVPDYAGALVALATIVKVGAPVELLVQLATGVKGLSALELIELIKLCADPAFAKLDALGAIAARIIDLKVPATRLVAIRKRQLVTPEELYQVLELAGIRPSYATEDALVAMATLVHAKFPCPLLVHVVTACDVAPDDLRQLCETQKLQSYTRDGVLLAFAQAVVAHQLTAARLIKLLTALQALAPDDFLALFELAASFDDDNLIAIGLAIQAVHAVGRSTLDVLKLARAGATAGRSGAQIAALLQPAQVGGLHPDVFGALSTAEVALLTAGQAAQIGGPQFARLLADRIPHLAPAAFAALDPACIAALLQPQAQQITGPQVEVLTQLQLAQLDRARLADVPAPALAHLTVARCAHLSDDQVDDLDPAQLTAWTGAQLAALPPSTFARLDDAQVQGLRVHHGAAITGDQLAQLHDARIPHLAAAVFARLSPQTIARLLPAQAQRLDQHRTPLLALAVIAALPPLCVAALPQAAGRALAPHQVAALTALQLPSLQANVGGGLGAAHIRALSADQVRLLDVGVIGTLTQPALRELTYEQLFGLTQAQVNALQNAQLMLMRQEQRARLMPRLQPAQAQHIRVTHGAPTVKLDLLPAANLPGIGAVAVGQITRFQISQMTRAHVVNIGAAEIAHFTGEQLAAIPVAFVSRLPDLAVGALSALQAPHLTSAQLTALRHEQVIAIPALALAALTTAQVQALSPRAVAALDQARTQALVTQQIVGLTPAQLGALTGTQWGWLANARLADLTPAQLAALPPAGLAKIPVAKLNQVDATAFAALPDAAIRALTPLQLAGLTQVPSEAQVAALLPSQIAHLDPAQLAAWPPRHLIRLADAPQVQALTAAQLVQLGASVAVLTRAQTAALLPAQLAALQPVQIPHLAHLGALGGAQRAALTPAQRALLTPEQRFDTAGLPAVPNGALHVAGVGAIGLPGLPAHQFSTVPLDELVALSGPEVAALTVPQVQQLTDVQLAALTQLGALQPDRIAALGLRLGVLTPAQLHAIDANGFAALGAADLAAIAPPEKIAALSVANLGRVTQVQWAGPLLQAHLQALTPAQLAALPTARLTELAARIAELRPAQIAALTPDQIAALANNQPSHLRTAHLQALTPPQCYRLTAVHLDGITQARLQALSPAQLAGLSRTAIATIAQATVRKLTGDQLASLPPSLFLQIPDGNLGHLRTTQQDALTAAQLTALELRLPQLPDLARLTERQLAGLTQPQIDDLIRNHYATLTREQLAWLAPRIDSRDVEALPPPALSNAGSVPVGVGTFHGALAPTTRGALGGAQAIGGPNLGTRAQLLAVLPTPRPGLRGQHVNVNGGNGGQNAALAALLVAVGGAAPAWGLEDENNMALGPLDDLLALPPIRLAGLVANIIVVHGDLSLSPWFHQRGWDNRDNQLPPAPHGAYREYDIYPHFPGAVDRGPHRLIIDRGGGPAIYYTPDHHLSFVQL